MLVAESFIHFFFYNYDGFLKLLSHYIYIKNKIKAENPLYL